MPAEPLPHRFEEHLRATGLLGRAAHVIAAVSGGSDSTALAHLLSPLAAREGWALVAVHVRHLLRGPAAERDAEEAGRLAGALGLPFRAVQADVPAGRGKGESLEAAARRLRYAALLAVAAELGSTTLVATGHTLDDQAETVLLGLGRGSGPRSIAGMRPVDARWIRPFLGLRRSVTEAACDALGLAPWHDPHNDDPAFQRVRLRREVLPLLDDVLQGGVAEALARTAALVRDDLDALDAVIDSLSATGHGGAGVVDHGAVLDVAAIAGQPRAIRTRLLRQWARRNGAGPLSAEHTAALDALVANWHGQGPLDLPGGRRAVRTSGRLEISTQISEPQEQASE